MSDLPPKKHVAPKPIPPWSEAAQDLAPGKYRHFKGNEYLVLGVVRHSETLEEMVIYHPEEDPDRTWVRPLEMFLEPVDRDGYHGPRFTYLGD
jgi:hypothetical protein